jgi:hypothetical protein
MLLTTFILSTGFSKKGVTYGMTQEGKSAQPPALRLSIACLQASSDARSPSGRLPGAAVARLCYPASVLV